MGSPWVTSPFLNALLVAVILAGSLALWTVVPVGWLYLTGELVPNGGVRFVLAIFGVPLSMAAMFIALSRLESHRQRLSPHARPLLEATLVASALLAVAGLVLWWFFLADSPDPSGPLQPI